MKLFGEDVDTEVPISKAMKELASQNTANVEEEKDKEQVEAPADEIPTVKVNGKGKWTAKKASD